MKKIHLTERDEVLLVALWKWKMLPSNAIWKGFFPKAGAKVTYMRLWRLRKGGFINWRTTNETGRGYVWILTQKGFRAIKKHLPELREDGFLSENIEHDMYVSAVHAGEWLINSPPSVELVSEQELRRCAPDLLPAWVPSSELHRPDGYWRVPLLEDMISIALEVELTQKSGLRYQIIATFYEMHEVIARTIWVVPSLAFANYIRAQIQKSSPSTLELHNFLLLDHIKQLGWSATVISGREKGRLLRDLLNGGVRKRSGTFLTQDLLDSRKTPGRSITSPTIKNPHFSD